MASIAARSFERTLATLGVDQSGDDAERLGRRAALLTAGELAWENQVGASFSGAQAAEFLGISRQAVHERHQRARLLALRGRDGSLTYPAFQFDPAVLPTLPTLLATLLPAVQEPETVAAWLTAPEPELDDRAPVHWLAAGGEVAPVLVQARRYAARLRQ